MDDKASGDLQIQKIKEFVGRHSDFMQVASSSSDLQNIVSKNKLAVVIGVELDNIGNWVSQDQASSQCGLGIFFVTSTQDCSSAITQEVDRLWGEGVRYIFPVHLVDNPIGGTAVYQDAFDVANVWEEGSAYVLGCSQPADNIGYTIGSNGPSLLDIINTVPGEAAKLGTAILPPPPRACTTPGTGNVNTKGLSAAGIAAIQEMMNKNMLIDVDHMSAFSVNATILLAQQHKPYPYPLFSGHNGVRASVASHDTSERSLTAQQYQEIGQLHGMAGVGSAKLTAPQWASHYNQVIQAMGPGAVAGFGTDTDGLEFAMPPNQISPAPTNGCPSGYGVATQNLSFMTLQLCQSIVQYSPSLPMSSEGSKSWDYNAVGVAHYGMLPDFLQDVALMPGGSVVVDNINNGAEYFYQTWRIAEGNPPPSPAPPPPPPKPRPSVGPS